MTTTTRYQDLYKFPDYKSDASTEGEEDIFINSPEKSMVAQYKFCNHPKSKAKSSLCKNYTQNGYCPYGDKCQFAHGAHQLKCNSDTNISYKTKYCNSFLNKKFCPYGFRCNFIHKSNLLIDNEQRCKIISENFGQVIQWTKYGGKSRLLHILEQSSL